MRLEPQTARELAQTFEFELLSAHLFGMTCSFGTDLPQNVIDRINDVAKAWPKDTPEMENAARAAIKGRT